MSCLLKSRRSATWTPVVVALFAFCSVAAFGQFSTPTSTVNFGSVQAGSMSSVPFPVTNTSRSNLTITQVTVSGSGFSFAGPNLPITLAPRQSANLYVTFFPQTAGASSGSATIMDSGSYGRWEKQHTGSLSVSLSGTGVSGGYLTPSPASVNFGNIPVGSKQTQSVSVTNSGGSSVGITQAAVSGNGFTMSGFTPQTLAAGQSITLSIGFTATSAGAANGTLSLASSATDANLSVALSGTGASSGYLTPSPASLNFGNVSVGSSQTQSVSVTNSGGSSVTLSQAAVSGNGFTMSAFTPQTLAAGQSITLSVAFTATSAGTANGMLNLSSTASDSSLSVALSGAGTSVAGQLAASPVSVSFGNVSVGASSNQSGVLTATGASVTVSSASSSNSQFTIGGISLPMTIASGQSVPFTVTFSPLVSGTVSGSLSFVSNASTSTVGETVSGTGQAAQYKVSLSWSPSTSTVTGYNVYRGTTSGGPYARVNPSVDTVTTYADSTVQSGQTYYYVTTSVASGGMESKYSNETSAQIP